MTTARELAWATVRRRPGRFAALAFSIALPALLVLDLSAVYLGLLEAMATYARTLGGDLVVTQAGTAATMMRSTARLSAETVQAVRAVPGVARGDEIVGHPAWVEQHEGGSVIVVIGMYPDDLVGGPPAMVRGRDRPEPGDIIVDRALAHDLGLDIGSPLQIAGATLRVSGIAAGGNQVVGTFAWVHRDVLALGAKASPSHLVLRLDADADREAVRRAIERIGGLRVYTPEQFVGETQAVARQIFRPLIGMIAGIAGIVGAMILGMSLWTATMDRRVEYALLRAMGFGRRTVAAIALWQAAITIAIGATAGIAGGIALARVIGRVQPRFVTAISPWACLAVASGAIAVGLLAAWLPVRAVARTDPARVFRA